MLGEGWGGGGGLGQYGCVDMSAYVSVVWVCFRTCLALACVRLCSCLPAYVSTGVWSWNLLGCNLGLRRNVMRFHKPIHVSTALTSTPYRHTPLVVYAQHTSGRKNCIISIERLGLALFYQTLSVCVCACVCVCVCVCVCTV